MVTGCPCYFNRGCLASCLFTLLPIDEFSSDSQWDVLWRLFKGVKLRSFLTFGFEFLLTSSFTMAKPHFCHPFRLLGRGDKINSIQKLAGFCIVNISLMGRPASHGDWTAFLGATVPLLWWRRWEVNEADVRVIHHPSSPPLSAHCWDTLLNTAHQLKPYTSPTINMQELS